MRYRLFGTLLLTALVLPSCVGCTDDEIAAWDRNGDGLVTASDLFTILVNGVCGDGSEAADPDDGGTTSANQ